MLAFFDSPQDYLLAVVALCVLCSTLFALFRAFLFIWSSRQDDRYPVYEPGREREPEIDLAKERYDFESRRDSYLEARMLRRVP